MSKKRILVTGAAGFIGYHLSEHLCGMDFSVVGLDSLNDYYDVSLKESRIKRLMENANFQFIRCDLASRDQLRDVFITNTFQYVVHLAAQAGVRYSLSAPHAYIDSNVVGFMNILECCRYYRPTHFMYASSSSVYGGNTQQPFSETQSTNHPLSLYAATKKTNELMAHAYSNLYNIPSTGLRFFTAYGPYGRPDMAVFIFTKSIIEGTPIDVYNFGKMKRGFTYIDDIIEAIVRLLPKAPKKNDKWNSNHPDPSTSSAPYRILNIGNAKPITLLYFIEVLEKKIGKKAIKNFLSLQAGDVSETSSDTEALHTLIEFCPSTQLEEGIGYFVKWYIDYYKVKM